jgi:hypothetical protein
MSVSPGSEPRDNAGDRFGNMRDEFKRESREAIRVGPGNRPDIEPIAKNNLTEKASSPGTPTKPGPKSYRAKSPYESETFPKGLPVWFKERDRNLDGQIFMGEFSTTWSDEIGRAACFWRV